MRCPPVTSFIVKDNGIGFTDDNRESFDTLYSDYRNSRGGKGFGRFICLRYFDGLEVKSVYKEGERLKSREFLMGRKDDIIVDERVCDSSVGGTGTRVRLVKVKEGKLKEKKIRTIARILAERLLPYLIDRDFVCPTITLSESDGTGRIVLNDFVRNQLSASILELPLVNDSFRLPKRNGEHEFRVRLFKFYEPKERHSKISLVAHGREVTETSIHKYIPEFQEEFFEKRSEDSRERNYVVKAYVFGDYLDENVSLERGGFEFPKESKTCDMIHLIAQNTIERSVAAMSREALGEEITGREDKKRQQVQSYVDEKVPWHRTILDTVDLSTLPCNPSEKEIELKLQEEKYRLENEVSVNFEKVLDAENTADLMESVTDLISQIF